MSGAMCFRACCDVRLVSLRGEPSLDSEEVEAVLGGGMTGGSDGGDGGGLASSPSAASLPQSRSKNSNAGTTLDRVLVEILTVSGARD